MPAASSGCQLPEELRRYYLEAMGIQLWTEKTDSAAEITIPDAVKVAPLSVQEPAAVQNNDWQSLQAEVAACARCELHQTRTQTVFGVGNQRADVLIVGEAPGQEEDARGEPFVGRAGHLLDAMLRAIDLQREQVYITNILKCRPPENRNPRPEEITHCEEYLHRQIDLLQPKIIFALGKFAAQTLLSSDDSVSAMRAAQHEYRGIPLLVSYHPAYLLRKPTEKRKSWHDLLRLKAMLG
jgi:uracil-DNA glycosylase